MPLIDYTVEDPPIGSGSINEATFEVSYEVIPEEVGEHTDCPEITGATMKSMDVAGERHASEEEVTGWFCRELNHRGLLFRNVYRKCQEDMNDHRRHYDEP
jgi:hypothetical protein